MNTSELEDEILKMARREASVEHVGEFEPIVRGPLFALLALAPLCVLALFRLVFGRSQR